MDELGELMKCFDSPKPTVKPKILKPVKQIKQKIESQFYKTALKRAMHKGKSEQELFKLFGDDLSDGMSYHVISGGDVDSLSFLQVVLNQQGLEYCLFSTWCMAMDDVLCIENWLKDGKIKKMDAYVGEIFTKTYNKEWLALTKIIKQYKGRVCVFRNHAKIYAGIGKKFSFAIESSANINTNPRTENTCLSIDDGLFKFYKNFFDGINSFDRSFDEWQPTEI